MADAETLKRQLDTLLANGLDSLLVQRSLSLASVNYGPLTVDPLTPRDGTIWYRSDLNAFRVRINGTTYSLVAGTFNTVANDVIWDAKGDLAAATGADAASKLAVGANTTVLTADSAQATGMKWAQPLTVATDTIWDTKGDLAAATGADAASKLAVGADKTILMADSGQTTGMKWQATPAVRTISLPFSGADNSRLGARVVTAYDAHGSFATYGPHVDNADADAAFKALRWSGIHVPSDFSSGMTLKFLFSSSVASNNAVFDCGARETLTGATGHTTSLNEGGNGKLVLACPGTANTIATGSIAFDVAPTPGRSLMVGIAINTNDANDSNTGTKTLWDVWLEYVPTL